MSVLVVIAVCMAGLAAAAAKGILTREIQGRIERRIERSVEATIASLPEALRDEFAEEWRAELAATLAMPLTAAAFARGLRRSASQLAGDGDVGTTAVDHASPPQREHRRVPDWAVLLPHRRVAVLRLALTTSGFAVSLLIMLEIVPPTLAIAVAIVLGVSEYMGRSLRRRLRR